MKLSIILILSCIICYLTYLMQDRPFSSENMREAYFHGCNIGSIKPITDESISKCYISSGLFKEVLDR